MLNGRFEHGLLFMLWRCDVVLTGVSILSFEILLSLADRVVIQRLIVGYGHALHGRILGTLSEGTVRCIAVATLDLEQVLSRIGLRDPVDLLRGRRQTVLLDTLH